MPVGDARYTHKAIGEMESIWGGSYVRARGELDLDAFGLGVMKLPPDFERMPSHVHTFDEQEEVYLPLAGAGWIEIAGDRIAIDPNRAVRVGPTASRRLVSNHEGLSVLVVGGTPGRAYEPFAPLEKGAPEPNPADLPGIRADAEHESSDDYTAASLDASGAIRGVFEGVTFYPLGRALGQRSFGIAVIELEDLGAESGYPLHSHDVDRQVEVFVVAEGAGYVVIDGSHIDVAAGEMVAIGPDAARQWFASGGVMRLITIGAPRDFPYAGNEPTLIEPTSA